MATTILRNSNFSLGVQVEFYYNWSQWIKNINQRQIEHTNQAHQSIPTSQQSTPIHSKFLGNMESTKATIHPQHLIASEILDTKNSEHFNLHEILSNGPYGPGVLSHYNENNSLNDKARKLLVKAFLHHCVSTGSTVSKAACRSLSMQIQDTFKGEIAVITYVTK